MQRNAPLRANVRVDDIVESLFSGIDVARRVLAIRPELPVLLASGYLRGEDVDIARDIGVREVIWKPTTINEMGELLGRTLARIIPNARDPLFLPDDIRAPARERHCSAQPSRIER